MKTTRKAIVVLPAIALLITGCGSSGTDPRPVSATPSSPTSAPPERPTTIPAGLRLRHQGEWAPYGEGHSLSPLPGVCIDPPPRLANIEPTDGRGVYDDEAATQDAEALGVYADDADAAEAVADWRDETSLCGAAGPQSHTGEPVEWFVRRAEVEGADEAWQAYELSEDVDGEDVSGADPFVTVARVGNAVYVESSSVPGHLDDDSIAAAAQAGAASVASYLPRLEPFRD